MKNEMPDNQPPTGQKTLSVLLDEMDAKWSALDPRFDITADNVALVKALRRAVEMLEWELYKDGKALLECRKKEIANILNVTQ